MKSNSSVADSKDDTFMRGGSYSVKEKQATEQQNASKRLQPELYVVFFRSSIRSPNNPQALNRKFLI